MKKYTKKFWLVNKHRKKAHTSYLFEKGVDKILKKVGEEATEVVIAAKNEQAELISETSDLLYHLLVLLVEKDVSLEAIEQEMAGRIGKKVVSMIAKQLKIINDSSILKERG